MENSGLYWPPLYPKHPDMEKNPLSLTALWIEVWPRQGWRKASGRGSSAAHLPMMRHLISAELERQMSGQRAGSSRLTTISSTVFLVDLVFSNHPEVSMPGMVDAPHLCIVPTSSIMPNSSQVRRKLGWLGVTYVERSCMPLHNLGRL
ncbi:hypothetical protein VPH35_066013 [Triticum aestivum]|uniref:uncharacterized protein isoform X1 n=1 Tax=Triticum aestivum TaxID=4565 RepID=UPI001D03364E|nr:uncharacterized protein LOC123086078 isoform X1 [Triticum aestivum]